MLTFEQLKQLIPSSTEETWRQRPRRRGMITKEQMFRLRDLPPHELDLALAMLPPAELRQAASLYLGIGERNYSRLLSSIKQALARARGYELLRRV